MATDRDTLSALSSDLCEVLLQAVEQSPSIVLITDLKGIIEYVNPKFAELTGYARSEVLNKNIRFLKSGEMEPEFYKELWDTIRKVDEWRGELHNRKKSGELYWESAVISAIRDKDGTLKHYLKVAEDVTLLKQTEEQRDKLMSEMRVMAMHDALTGLYSRRMFDDELDRAWKTGERHDIPTGLLVIDIDYFKSFNDTYGHQIGDQLLIEAARLIENTARAGDIVCRYGGDEIVVILPMATLEATSHVGARLLEAFRSNIFCADSHKLQLTASIGAASGSPNTQPAHAVLMRADQALYHAKKHGRNVLCLSDPDSPKPFVLVGQLAGNTAAPEKAPEKAKLLLLSEMGESLSTLCSELEGDVFTAVIARDSDDAVSIVQQDAGAIDIVLLDSELRTDDDSDPLKRIWLIDDAISAVLIVKPDDTARVAASGREGSIGIIVSPVSADNLIPALEKAMKQHHFLLEERRYRRHLQDMVSDKSRKLQDILHTSSDNQKPVAELMTIIFEAYERKTGEHCKRVEKIVRIMSGKMQIDGRDRDAIEKGAFLHDIGKIGIPDSILLKEAPLTLEEWKTMRLHPQIGYDLLKNQPSLEGAARIVLEHHERYDGSGYPDGKKGSSISMGARIFAIADAYDAMRADRPYAASISPRAAASEIKSSSGTHFDPEVVEVLLRCQPLIESQVYAASSI